MSKVRPIWLASFPRSGNTFLRTILWHCFSLKSASIYTNDLGNKKELEEYVGHIERDENKRCVFPPNGLPLFKTHKYPQDDFPAIYIVRDGRAATSSLFNFYGGKSSIERVIEGNHPFGIWANHVLAWKPWERPQTLFLRYEELVNDLDGTLRVLSQFLKREIVSNKIPDRNEISNIDGRWVRKKAGWQENFNDSQLERFYELNGDLMRALQYKD